MDLEENFETRDFEIELLKGARIAETQVFVSVSICMFPDQTQSNAVIDDVSCMIGCNCSSYPASSSSPPRKAPWWVDSLSAALIP
jgi:hypothetical protein